jgi:LacI family transcriptional regulator
MTAQRRKRSPRFVEIAKEAAVSPSSVDRVLNERGSVSPATREKVIAAAKRLDIPRRLPDTRHGLVHLDILLPRNDTPFFQRLNLALQRSLQMLDRRMVVHRVILQQDDDDAITRAIARSRYQRCGLIITAHDTVRVREALCAVIAGGEPVVTLVTDIGAVPRLHYAGIDNYHAGRTAGYFLGRLARRPGRILLLANRMDYAAHIDRMRGCRDAVAASFPELGCDAPSVEIHDDANLCYQAVCHALHSDPHLAGIYNSAAGSQGIEAALL